MQQRPQNFEDVDGDPEATLITPRFDAEEARRASPVVPLPGTHARTPFFAAHAGTPFTEAQRGAPYVNAHVAPRRGPRRSWPTALIAVALLAAVAAGAVVATTVLRRPLSSEPAQTESNAPAQTEAAPAPSQTEAAPAHTADVPQPQEASPASEAPREEARVRRPSRQPREARGREGMILAPAEIVRGDDEDSDDRDRERRGRGRDGRRERDDDEAEKEMRKALKRAKEHAKGKAPRLVDVLTGP